ncbi:MAG TPA: dihydroorotate dehydrogenase electron transfer subunit [Candidatus Lokiarchaeia archaeon]|nr:dihydroorotate dehydrogenase electron transfer subunit [Candidatus Lokiarchaeia archaeon]
MITKIQKGWKELKAEIVDTDKCCLCGACVNFCDNLAMTPAGPAEQGMLCEEQSTCREGFGTCYNLCPYTGMNAIPLSLLDRWVHDKGSLDNANEFNHDITIVAARFTGSYEAGDSNGGSAAAGLLTGAMRSGIIDGVLTSHLNADVPRVVTTEEDILATSHATAFANAPLSGISPAISAGYESLAVIGSGCEIQGLRKMQNHPDVDLEVHDLVTLAIGAFCFFKPKPSRLESFLDENGAARSAIERIDHDGGAFKYAFKTGDETLIVPANELYDKTAKGSCASCEDGTASLADISIGAVDALPGWDVLVIRTETGMKVFKATIELGLIETQEVNNIVKNAVLEVTRNKVHFAAIESIEDTGVDTRRFIFTASDIARNYKPGQFVVLWLPDVDFLPMSIERVIGDKISILVQQIGEGTATLFDKEAGDEIGIRGPYGNGWDLTKNNYLVVGGGVGIAEVTNAIDYLVENKKKIAAIFGGRTKDHLPCVDLFETSDLQACIMTDDGSAGQKGFATDPIEGMIEEHGIENIITCGPEIMMRKVYDIAREHEIPVQASLERMMKCCVGLCGTCCVGAENDITACKMGPVFDQDRLAKIPQFGSYKKG